MSYKNIIICTDYSDQSLHALKYANSIAKKVGANLGVVHICDSFDNNSVVFKLEEKVADGKTYKELVADNLKLQMNLFLEKAGLNPSEIKEHIGFGNIKKELGELFSKENYDLAVFGQHGHNFLTDVLLGSVTEKMLRVSPIDVLVVKNDYEVAPSTIHTTVDFTELSNSVVNKTKEIASSLGASVTLSHLVELNPKAYLGVSEMDGLNSTNSIQKVLEEEKSLSEKKLEELKAKIESDSVKVSTLVHTAKDFRIAENIIEYENSVEHDLTIVGAHGKSVLERFFFGSTAARFIEQTNNNVLVIKK